MRMGWTRPAVLALLLMGAGAASTPERMEAQERDRTCRCVDGDGAELENCVCVRMPDVERMVIGPLGRGLERPRLGISLEITEPSAQTDGARIADVLEGGPADRAGLREGDVVTRLDGRALTEPLDGDREGELDPDRALPPQRLLALVRDIEAGEEVEVEYLRDGRIESTTVEAEELDPRGRFSFHGSRWDAEDFGIRMRELGDRMREMRPPRAPDAPMAFRFERGDAPVWFDLRGRFGSELELVAVNPELGSYFGTDRGVLVASVPEGSALGLRPGDVILEIDGRAAEDPGRVRSILASYDPEEAITFRVRRDGREIDVSGRVGGPAASERDRG